VDLGGLEAGQGNGDPVRTSQAERGYRARAVAARHGMADVTGRGIRDVDLRTWQRRAALIDDGYDERRRIRRLRERHSGRQERQDGQDRQESADRTRPAGRALPAYPAPHLGLTT
jgi:hypothetical protein